MSTERRDQTRRNYSSLKLAVTTLDCVIAGLASVAVPHSWHEAPVMEVRACREVVVSQRREGGRERIILIAAVQLLVPYCDVDKRNLYGFLCFTDRALTVIWFTLLVGGTLAEYYDSSDCDPELPGSPPKAGR